MSDGSVHEPVIQGSMLLAGHLGGYLVGGDPGSYYPAMWKWLIEAHEIESVVDVGCGEGHSLSYFAGLGCDVLGIEGVPQDDPRIALHDYTQGPFVLDREYDLCWSCEFVEHVEERYMSNFLATFSGAKMLLITHAQPGQGGHHHVNCQPDEYWIEAVRPLGFKLDRRLTNRTKKLVEHGYWLWSGLAFRR